MIIDGYSESSIVYLMDKQTKEYLGEGDAIFDPIVSKDQGKNLYIAPKFSTFKKPPELKENEIAIHAVDFDEWNIYKDFRGVAYYENNGETIIITKIGDEVPPWAPTEPPPSEFSKPVWDREKWIETQSKPPLKYRNIDVTSIPSVDMVTQNAIKDLGEEKAKTEKMLAGNNSCPIWDEFITKREELLNEGRAFKKEHFSTQTGG